MLATVFTEGLPALSLLLADFFNPPPAELAAAFGVNRSTVYRWLKTDRAPRPVLLSLYLAAPSYGQRRAAEVIEHAEHGMRLAQALADARKAESDALRRELARVLSVGDFGSANAPSFTASTAAELMAARG